jgi:CRP-like cAMP-binding protein
VDIAELVPRITVFRDLTEEQAARVAEVLSLRTREQDEPVCREGERGDLMFVLCEGRVEVSRRLTLHSGTGEAVSTEKALNVLDGSTLPVIGEVAMVDDLATRTADIRTLTPCTMLELGRTDFDRLCREDADLGYKLVRNVCRTICAHLRRSNDDVLKLATALSIALSR